MATGKKDGTSEIVGRKTMTTETAVSEIADLEIILQQVKHIRLHHMNFLSISFTWFSRDIPWKQYIEPRYSCKPQRFLQCLGLWHTSSTPRFRWWVNHHDTVSSSQHRVVIIMMPRHHHGTADTASSSRHCVIITILHHHHDTASSSRHHHGTVTSL